MRVTRFRERPAEQSDTIPDSQRIQSGLGDITSAKYIVPRAAPVLIQSSVATGLFPEPREQESPYNGESIAATVHSHGLFHA
jgi:hypothetical protein